MIANRDISDEWEWFRIENILSIHPKTIIEKGRHAVRRLENCVNSPAIDELKKQLQYVGRGIAAQVGELRSKVAKSNYGAFASEYPRYISDDGTIFVHGPDWSGEGGDCIYPIWVARKKFGLFWWIDKKLCESVSSGSSGNVTLETADKSFGFADCSRCYSASECGVAIAG